MNIQFALKVEKVDERIVFSARGVTYGNLK